MADEQDKAEELDADKMGAEFPPDAPLGTDDPQVPDSVASRQERKEPELVPDADRPVLPYPAEEGTPVVPDPERPVEQPPVTEPGEGDGEFADRLPAEQAAIHPER